MATVRILPVGVGCGFSHQGPGKLLLCLGSAAEVYLPAITSVHGIYFLYLRLLKMMTRLFPGRMDRYARRLLKSLVGFSCDTSKVKVQIVKCRQKLLSIDSCIERFIRSSEFMKKI